MFAILLALISLILFGAHFCDLYLQTQVAEVHTQSAHRSR